MADDDVVRLSMGYEIYDDGDYWRLRRRKGKGKGDIVHGSIVHTIKQLQTAATKGERSNMLPNRYVSIGTYAEGVHIFLHLEQEDLDLLDGTIMEVRRKNGEFVDALRFAYPYKEDAQSATTEEDAETPEA